MTRATKSALSKLNAMFRMGLSSPSDLVRALSLIRAVIDGEKRQDIYPTLWFYLNCLGHGGLSNPPRRGTKALMQHLEGRLIQLDRQRIKSGHTNLDMGIRRDLPTNPVTNAVRAFVGVKRFTDELQLFTDNHQIHEVLIKHSPDNLFKWLFDEITSRPINLSRMGTFIMLKQFRFQKSYTQKPVEKRRGLEPMFMIRSQKPAGAYSLLLHNGDRYLIPAYMYRGASPEEVSAWGKDANK